MQILKIINWFKLNIVALHLIVCAKRVLKNRNLLLQNISSETPIVSFYFLFHQMKREDKIKTAG